MPEEIKKFISGFEDKFGTYLATVTPIKKVPGRLDPIYTKHFSIFPGENKYSDWDLTCRVLAEFVTLDVLSAMRKYTHEFPELSNVSDFVGNEWFQIMAFMPESDFAPFFDIHIEGIPDSLRNEYLNSSLNPEKSRQETNEWLVLIWLRKKKNHSPEASHMISDEGWLHWALTSEQLEEIRKDSEGFMKKYFAGRGYDAVLEFLK